MTSQPIAPSRPAPSARGSARHGRIRTAVARWIDNNKSLDQFLGKVLAALTD